MMMVAAQYKAMLDTFKDDAFNAMFPNGKGLYIAHTGTPAGSSSKESMASGSHPFDAKKAYVDRKQELNIQIDPTDPTKDLLPGDWVYFENVPGYLKTVPRLSHLVEEDFNINKRLYVQGLREVPPEFGSNAWQGEHAVYLGGQEFAGFGIPGKLNYGQMLRALFNAYMAVLQAYYNHPHFVEKWGQNTEMMKEREEVLAMTFETAVVKPQLVRIIRFDYSKLADLGK
jgi:hypothetical protein